MPLAASAPVTLANVPAVVSFACVTENCCAVSTSVRLTKSEFAASTASTPMIAFPLISTPASIAFEFVIAADETGVSFIPPITIVIIFLIGTVPS